MKHSALIYCLLFLISFSCKKSNDINFEEVSLTAKDNIVSINVPKAIGALPLSELINSEMETLISTTLHIGDPDNIPKRTIDESISFFNVEYDQFKIVFPDSDLQWEAQIDAEVIYQSPEVISIAFTAYLNTGGAHGNSIISLLNFDKESATVIKNDSIFKDNEVVIELAKKHFKNEVEFPSQYFFGEKFHLPANIGFNEDGVIFLYNTYEIAPYSSGITEFTIPYNEIASYLNFQ